MAHDERNRSKKYASMDGFIPASSRKRTDGFTPRTLLSARHPNMQIKPLPAVVQASLPRADRPTNSKAKIRQRRHKRTGKQVIVRSAIVVFAFVLLVGGWLGWRGLTAVNRIFHGNAFSDAHALFGNARLKGEDKGRVNILLAGDSADDPNHGGAELTDSIMILSVDTRHHTGFMLSIPRDLWVSMPGWSHQKINAANNVTNFNQAGYPKGGMGQLEQIIQTDLGISINYYTLVNYTALKDVVSTLGGVNVNIQSPDPRGLYDPNISKADSGPLFLKNGLQTLDGQTALNLARARGDPTYDGRVEYGFPNSDFDRTQHQRQLIVAIEQKASSAGVVANPLKVSRLFSAIGNNIATDFTIPEVLRAAQLVKGLDIAKLQSLSLSTTGNNPLLRSYTTPSGQLALIPNAGIDNFGQIQQYYSQLTSSNPIVKESPTSVVLNASDVVGLAHKDQMFLQNKGFNVLGIADASSIYPKTMIVDITNGQKPQAKQALEQLFPGSTVATNASGSPEAAEARGYTADFIVILGQDKSAFQ